MKSFMLATESRTKNFEDLNLPHVELSFNIFGETLPADHGYALYPTFRTLAVISS